MYRTKADFLTDWSTAAEGTIQVMDSLTDNTLDQAIVEGHSTLGWLGWHLAMSLAFFGGQAGLNIKPAGDPENVPNQANTIKDAYKTMAEELKQEAEQSLTDEKMTETVDFLGNEVPRGAVLRSLVDHQTHHRGQMTVLLRQAGLPVPGVMGPTKEQQA
ncbi:DinB family protein [Oceanobacillus halotolerans]|uniref:DinB family protein n=1 Tax=Oceanobacillus halotolerans TaxID=2663380 RepID=UPI0013DA5F3C|nr:DinB family protein [Oceanobacillus halotolerans]